MDTNLMPSLIFTPNRPDWLKNILKDTLTVLILTTLVGLSISVMSDKTLMHSLRYAWSIGLSILIISYILCDFGNKQKKTLFVYVLAVPLGGLIGVAIGAKLNGGNVFDILINYPQGLTTSVVSALLFGTAITYYFYSRNRIAESETQIQREKARQARNEQKLVEIELSILQAQIEPHFLFNTLSNVLALIENDSKKASTMLEALTLFLRASLKRTRMSTGTLRDELNLVDSYLTIHAIRMRDRLSFNINVSLELLDLTLPPLLIQPLVENAIRHGLEPMKEKGAITITAKSDDQSLIIEVADTGHGLNTESKNDKGIGLNNVRQRLHSLYKNRARLELLENKPHGVRARVYIPLQGAFQHE